VRQVLNMLGKVVTMKPAALQKKRENKNTVALDSEQNAIQVEKFLFLSFKHF
jgi:transcription elongation factor SPT5